MSLAFHKNSSFSSFFIGLPPTRYPLTSTDCVRCFPSVDFSCVWANWGFSFQCVVGIERIFLWSGGSKWSGGSIFSMDVRVAAWIRIHPRRLIRLPLDLWWSDSDAQIWTWVPWCGSKGFSRAHASRTLGQIPIPHWNSFKENWIALVWVGSRLQSRRVPLQSALEPLQGAALCGLQLACCCHWEVQLQGTAAWWWRQSAVWALECGCMSHCTLVWLQCALWRLWVLLAECEAWPLQVLLQGAAVSVRACRCWVLLRRACCHVLFGWWLVWRLCWCRRKLPWQGVAVRNVWSLPGECIMSSESAFYRWLKVLDRKEVGQLW